MLTKSDTKIIGDLFDIKFDKKFDEKFDEKFKPIGKDIKIIKNDVKKLKKDVAAVIDMSDKGLLKVQTRVKIIERHLGFPEADFA